MCRNGLHILLRLMPHRGKLVSRSGGFTLIEMLIVLLILGILVTLGQPALVASIEEARIYAVVSEVSTALRFARDSAMGTARPTRVFIQPALEVITVSQLAFKRIADFNNPAVAEIVEAWVESAAEASFVTMKHPMKPGQLYQIDYVNAADFSGVDIVATTFTAPPEIEFDSTGLPSEGGQVVVAYGNRQATITVEAATGNITESW